jgi:hypothetical protein
MGKSRYSGFDLVGFGFLGAITALFVFGPWVGDIQPRWCGEYTLVIAMIAGFVLPFIVAACTFKRKHEHRYVRELIATYYPLDDRVGTFVRYDHVLVRCECGDRREEGELWLGDACVFTGRWCPLPNKRNRRRDDN